jgi:hypothetical protein
LSDFDESKLAPSGTATRLSFSFALDSVAMMISIICQL